MNDEKKLCLGYQEALNQLRKHPELIWTRNNFFLLIQSGLLAFTLNIDPQKAIMPKVFAVVAGLLMAVGWLWANCAGRSLQRKWRDIVIAFETELFKNADGTESIKGPFQRAKESGEGMDSSVSITLILIFLSTAFVVLWIILLLQMLF